MVSPGSGEVPAPLKPTPPPLYPLLGSSMKLRPCLPKSAMHFHAQHRAWHPDAYTTEWVNEAPISNSKAIPALVLLLNTTACQTTGCLQSTDNQCMAKCIRRYRRLEYNEPQGSRLSTLGYPVCQDQDPQNPILTSL